MKNTETLVVVHLSATAVYVVIGNVVSVKDIQIMGVGQVNNSDFYQGQIKHRERLQSAIKKAIQEAEDMANCRVHSVWLTLSTPELLSKNSMGEVQTTDGEVRIQDMVNALSRAKSHDLPSNYYLMHCCQQGIYIDDQESMVDDAIEMIAQNIAVMYHMMMMPVASRQNIQKLLQSCDVGVDHVVFDAVTSAEYCLSLDDRQQGICLIDIGASTSSICIYKENKLIFTYCLPSGSHEVTMDISADLNISMIEAEELKKQHGTVDISSVDPSAFFSYPRYGTTEMLNISDYKLTQIIEARYAQIFDEIASLLQSEGLTDFIDRGIMLTGGGSAMKGMVPFAKRRLRLPVVLAGVHSAIRVYPHVDSLELRQHLESQLKNRAYHTAFGTLLYSQSDQFRHSEQSEPEAVVMKKGMLYGMKQGFGKIFKKIM